MKTILCIFIAACALSAQTIPTLPPVSTLTVGSTTCSFSVADAQMSVATECLASDGSILWRSVALPSVKGAVLGTGAIACLYWTDGAATPTVRLQCSTDDDVSGPKLALDGKLAPVTKKRQWWLFWR